MEVTVIPSVTLAPAECEALPCSAACDNHVIIRYRWSKVLKQVLGSNLPMACRRAAQNNWSLSSGSAGSVMQAQAPSSAACTVPAKLKFAGTFSVWKGKARTSATV